MIKFKYHHSETPSKLTDISIDQQQLLASQKDKAADFTSALREDPTTTFEVVLAPNPQTQTCV